MKVQVFCRTNQPKLPNGIRAEFLTLNKSVWYPILIKSQEEYEALGNRLSIEWDPTTGLKSRTNN